MLFRSVANTQMNLTGNGSPERLTGSRGTARYETLSAIPIDDFIASL